MTVGGIGGIEAINDIDGDAISDLVHKEAKKAGISAKDTRKAIKKIKSGSVMSQIAPELESSFMNMNPNQTPRDKLHAKIKKLQGSRASAVAKSHTFEQMKQKVYDDREKEALEKEQEKERKKRQAKNHRKKLNELERSVGVVTQKQYTECMTRMKEDKYGDAGNKNRDKNIIELYCKQQSFSAQLDMSNLEELTA
jgi:hypothetical protein